MRRKCLRAVNHLAGPNNVSARQRDARVSGRAQLWSRSGDSATSMDVTESRVALLPQSRRMAFRSTYLAIASPTPSLMRTVLG